MSDRTVGLSMERGGAGREQGFSLMEVMVATVIAVLAVLGLAHSFAAGRGLVDRYATARAALARAQGEIDRLATLATPTHLPGHTDLSIGMHGPFTINPLVGTVGQEWWTIAWVDDPSDGTGGGDAFPNDYRRATYYVSWRQSGTPDTVILTRTLSAP